MTEIYIFIAGQTIGIIGAAITAYMRIDGRISALSERLVKLETTIDLMGVSAAKALHSPHDPYKLDALLDKYIDRHYELSSDEWAALMEGCEQVKNNSSLPKEERMIAGILAAVCHHKLQHSPSEEMKLKL